MPVGDDTLAYRRDLPHLTKSGKTYFVTFRTSRGVVLDPSERDVVLASSIHDHTKLCWMHCVVVMPDHAHLIVTPFEISTLESVLRRMKGASGYRINKIRHRHGRIWQRESFDHIVRGDEKLSVKAEYMRANPVRAGLVDRCEDYRWWWRAE